jgi:hypothetical protein
MTIARLCLTLLACGWFVAGCGDRGEPCSFTQENSVGDYNECVAAGGTVVAATDLTPTFCVMRYSPYALAGRTEYDECVQAGGYSFSWDVWCPAPLGTIGGDICQVFYPENGCPTGRKPDDYSWPLPSCS